MKLSEVKNQLQTLQNVAFQLPNGNFVPEHFHVTEVGLVTKKFIDCGGTLRQENVANFQLWDANDVEHRLKPKKLLDIIMLSEKILEISDLEIEVEYQDTTIGKYDLSFNGQHFVLMNKQTACLAQDQCGIPSENQNIKLSDANSNTSFTPGGNCC